MLPFSPGPVPTTDEELTDRLTRGLLSLLRPQDPARVQVTCTGAAAEHVPAMHIDLSGADLDPVAAEVPAAGGTPVLHAVSVVTLLVIAMGAATSWRALQQTPPDARTDGGMPVNRDRFLAQLGLAASALFAVAVIAGAIPQWVVDACY